MYSTKFILSATGWLMMHGFDLKKSNFFLRFFEELDFMSEKTVEMFQILDQIVSVNPDISFERYLINAMFIVKNTEKTFVKRRGLAFFTWIFEKLSHRSIKLYPHLPSCLVECYQHHVTFPFRSKEVLGFFIEAEKIHVDVEQIKPQLLERIKNILFVEGSALYIVDRKKSITNTILYFEAQRKAGVFTASDIEKIKYEINEIIMQNANLAVASLENYEFLIKTLRWMMNEIDKGDLPHVFIDFNKQTLHTFYFSVLVGAIKDEISLNRKLKHSQLHVEWSTVEKRGGVTKEGVIVHVEIPMSSFFSIIAARKEVSCLLHSLLGDYRDFNGGLLEKIEENFTALKAKIAAPVSAVQEFFNSISPQSKQATLPIKVLEVIYEELEKHKQSDRETQYSVRQEHDLMAITIKVFPEKSDWDVKKALALDFPSLFFASVHRPTYTIICCFLMHPTPQEIDLLTSKTRSVYESWSRPEELKHTLRLCSNVTFDSFDPRMGTEQETSYLHKMLFEGLMRMDPSGNPEPAIAEKVEISDNGKCYRFFLRKTFWSNGMPVTAEDFVYSWQMSLTPGFFAPLIYLFNVIENAEAIRNGELPSDKLAVRAISDQILEVNLNCTDPYFLETCTLSLFFPICKNVDMLHPSWAESQGEDFVCNGPFALDRKIDGQYLVLKKNSYYHNDSQVHLKYVLISFLDEEKSLQLFQRKKIDALLYPFCRNTGKALIKKTNPSMFYRDFFSLDILQWIVQNLLSITKKFG